MSNDLTTVRMSQEEWATLELWAGVHPRDGDGHQYRATWRGVDYVVTLHVREDGTGYSTSAPVVFT